MLSEKIALIKRTNGLNGHSESHERKRFVEAFIHSTHKKNINRMRLLWKYLKALNRKLAILW